MRSSSCSSGPCARSDAYWNGEGRMDEMLADILQTCLVRIDAGASVDECLAAYPQQREALEAPLTAAMQLRRLPRPALPAATQAALETRMLALAAQRRAAPAVSSNGYLPQVAP